MEQNMRFKLILGRLTILKKIGAKYEQLLRAFFSCFQGQKFFFGTVVSALKKLHIVSFIYFFMILTFSV